MRSRRIALAATRPARRTIRLVAALLPIVVGTGALAADAGAQELL